MCGIWHNNGTVVKLLQISIIAAQQIAFNFMEYGLGRGA
jgi:hypothetical protein